VVPQLAATNKGKIDKDRVTMTVYDPPLLPMSPTKSAQIGRQNKGGPENVLFF